MTKTLLDQLNTSQEQILKTTIDLVTQKELWKNRAEKLAYRYHACLECAENHVKLTGLRCGACLEKLQAKTKEDHA